MGAELRIDTKLRVVHSRYYSEVTLADVLQQRSEMAAHPDFDPSYALIIDLTDVTRLSMGAAEISTIAHSPTPVSRLSQHIFIAPRPDLYGIGRMYQMMGDQTHPNTVVVASMEEAKRFLSPDQ
jgi:hypothetical protein